MKKLYTVLLFCLTAVSFAQQALPFSDSFGYTAGNLHTTAPWNALGTPNASDHILIDGTKATFDGAGTDVQLTVTAPATGTIFYKFNLRVNTMAGVTDVNGGYFAGFAQNTTTFGGTVWTKRIDDTSFNVGLETRTATGASTTYTVTSYPTATNITVVVAYTLNAAGTSDDTARLWINPAANAEANPLLTDTHVGADLTGIASFFLRQDSVTETPAIEIDDLRISTTFADVLSSDKFTTIPGLSIYPNPATKGQFFITSNSGLQKSVSVFDVLGKQVLKANITDAAINVATLKSGVYFVKVTEDGKTATRKLVINN
jgi:hypothetical protein